MANPFANLPGFKWTSFLVLSILLASCTGMSPVSLPDPPPLKDQPVIEIEDVNLLSISPAMQEFVEQHAYDRSNPEGRAWSLAAAAMDPYLLSFRYDPRVTLPAAETFSTGKGNCLSFSSMFVAMARAADLTAYFQEVSIPPNWRNVNDHMLVSKHVNAVAYDKGKIFTVDVSRRTYPESSQTRRLSDSEAKAQFYNNLGVDALIEQNIALAYAYFVKALKLDSRLDYIWSNLGVIYRRNGQTDEAIFAYRTALKLEPDQRVALNNLYVIYTEDENLEAAEKLWARVERNQKKNPYYLKHLAEVAVEEKRLSDAISLAKRAIRIDGGEYRFYYILAQSQYRAGRIDQAMANLDKAKRLAPGREVRDSLTLPGIVDSGTEES